MTYKINQDLIVKGLNEMIKKELNTLEHTVNDNFSAKLVLRTIAEYSDALKMAEGRISHGDMEEYLTVGKKLIEEYFKK